MRVYLIQRIALAIPTVLLVAVVTFIVMHVLPGDAALVKAASTGAQDQAALYKAYRHDMGLDRPAYVQFGDWIWHLLRHGDLGKSYGTQDAVTHQILTHLPVTLELALGSILIGLTLAIPWGVIAATRRDRAGDYVPRIVSVFLLSVPNFWVATLFVVMPAIWFHYMPTPGYVSFFEHPAVNVQEFFLPCLALGSRLIGATLRMTRSSMLEVLQQDYVRTAWAKGLRARTVLSRHALKNALIPVVSLVGGQIAFLLGGSVIVENVFGLPGLGNLTIQAIYQRDYPQIQGDILLIALIVVAVNLLTDLSYGWLDPRIRYR
jgi:peptide/nickel transport system permease protein